jgi:hypothetical protein
MKSWRTTALGLVMIIVALGTVATAYLDTDPGTNPDWFAVGAAIVGGIRLIISGEQTLTGIGEKK